MNREPIHENLSTSFVDLEALVKHLKDLQFVGSIHIELSSYEADIIFASDESIHAREYDHILGRTAHGMDALKRILRRAQEPFGRIHVFRSVPQMVNDLIAEVHIDPSISVEAHGTLRSKADTPAFHMLAMLPENDREGYRELALDLLQTVDASLHVAGLDFRTAFRNASMQLASIYPFLHPASGSIRLDTVPFEMKVPDDVRKFNEGLVEVLSLLFSRMTELARRAETVEMLHDDIETFVRRRWHLLERLGLKKMPDALFQRI